MSSLKQYFDIDRMMADNELILAYRDHVTDSTVQQLLSITELKLMQTSDDKKMRKRVFNILVECLQNIVNHGASEEKGDRSASLLLIGRHGNDFFINTGNKIDNDKVQSFIDKVDEVNNLVHDNMRSIYSTALDESEYSEKGGAGLGLLDIYKRSGNKLRYDVQPIDDRVSFLSLHIRINSDS